MAADDEEQLSMRNGNAGSPNSDGPGNRAWREATAQLALVQAAEMAAG